MEVLLFFGLFWLVCECLALLGPLIIEGVGYAIGFLLYGIWLILRWIGLCLWAVSNEYLAPWIATGYHATGHWLCGKYVFFILTIKDAALLLVLVVQEMIHPTPDEEFEEEEDFEEDDDEGDGNGNEDGAQQAFDAACARLCLCDPFTQAELKTAYRRAIAIAHPDRGGTTEDSQAVNEARARIVQQMGWDT